MKPVFEIKEHIVPCQHLRENFVGCVGEVENTWRMHVKQYTPLDNLEPQEGDVTIIGACGNGFVKELYEPFWDDLYHILSERGIKIRGIWVADTANSGSSSKLNPHLRYDSVMTWDHARDLLQMTNLFSKEILHPIIGVGHSIGASQLAMLSLLHPSLFTSLVLLDPILVAKGDEGTANALISFALCRKNRWGSRAEAEVYFKKAFRGWDRRVLEKWMEFAVEEGTGGGEMKLVWERQQELTSYLQFPHIHNFNPTFSSSQTPSTGQKPMAWAQAPLQIYALLPNLSTHILILCGSTSPSATQDMRDDWSTHLCTNPMFQKIGRERKVQIEALEGVGHFFPFEVPRRVAVGVGEWIKGEIGERSVWRREWEAVRRWRGLSMERKRVVSEEWMEDLKSRL